MPLIVVVGATATGKSDLALDLAAALDGEIVNADASQLYRGMDVGTAKTPREQRRGIPHHQLDVLDITDTASVAAFQTHARADIDAIQSRGRIPILVGGSGLYVKAVIDPLEFPGTDPALRARIEQHAQQVGPAALHDELAAADPAAAAAILPSNLRRVVRALEVIQLTGRPFSATLPREDYVRDTVQLGLRRATPLLDERIDTRIQLMLDAGWLAEVRRLAERGLREGRTARTALGYNQLLDVLDGRLDLDGAAEQIASATRAFARRQIKWFRRDQRIHWFDPDEQSAALDWALDVLGGRP